MGVDGWGVDGGLMGGWGDDGDDGGMGDGVMGG